MESDGYYVKKDGDIVANSDLWGEFTKAALLGKNTSIRIIDYYTDWEAKAYYSDLFFQDGHYYLFKNDSDNQRKESYLHLLILERKIKNEIKDRIIVLTDDSTLTYSEVWKSIISSNLTYVKSHPKFEIAMFLY